MISTEVLSLATHNIGNVTVEQRQFFKARELDVGLYHVVVSVIFFALLLSKVYFVMHA
jgi:hypothetical protein